MGFKKKKNQTEENIEEVSKDEAEKKIMRMMLQHP